MSNDIKSILIENHKVVFLVFSKNACTSMKAHIIKTMAIPQTVIYPSDVHGPRVYDYPYISDEELVSTYQSYLRLCIIRNPWSRLVSCFKDKIKEEDVNNQLYKNGVHIRLVKISEEFRGGMSFSDFANIICEIPDSKADAHFRSQLYDMVTPSGKLRANYIAKLENLEAHFNEINQSTGMGFDDFPRLNNTKKRQPYTEYYTPEIIEKIRERYKGDIELFNYNFGEEDEFNSGFIDDMIENKILESPFYSKIVKEKSKAINRKNQESSSEKKQKIFCIGLNKTGTRSLNAALNILKLRAIHHDSDLGRIGEIFKFNLENNKNLLTGLEGSKAFSDWIDMEGTNNHFFKVLDQQYPGSKFIFTDRGIESWIESRIQHVKKIDRLEAFQKAYPDSNWHHMNTDAWRAEYKKHKEDVFDYFKDRKNDLLVFNMFEGDGWRELCSFLNKPVPKRHFPSRGKSAYTKKTFIKVNILKGNIFLPNKKTIFYFLPGSGNLPIKASLISLIERKRKFEFPNNIHLVNDFPFPTFKKPESHPSFKEQFRFTIVRNPWDRLVDCYKEMICSDDLPERFFKVGAEDTFNEYGDLFRKNMPFDEFIEQVCSIPESKSNRHFCSQIYQLTSPTGELLVNYIGYYENLKKAASDIFEQSQISLHEIPLSKAKIDDTSYTKMYTERLQEMVKNKFADDIDLFGYEFGVPLENQAVDFVSDQFISQYTGSKNYIDFLKEKNKRLNQQLTNSLRETNLYKEDLSRVEYEMVALGSGGRLSDIKEIQNSLSWKITAPMRFVGSLLNKLSSRK